MLAFKLLLKLFNNINFDITLGRYKPQGNVVDLFSGQGSQYLEIGRELAINFPVLQQTYNQINNLFCKAGLSPISEKVFPAPVFDIVQRQTQAKVLQQTEVSQPAIAASGIFCIKYHIKLVLNRILLPDTVLANLRLYGLVQSSAMKIIFTW